MMSILDSVAFWASVMKLAYLNLILNLPLLDSEFLTMISMKTTALIVKLCSSVRDGEAQRPMYL